MSSQESTTPTLEGLDPEAVKRSLNPELEDKTLGAKFGTRKFVYTTRNEAAARLEEIFDSFNSVQFELRPEIDDTLRPEEAVISEIKKALMVYKNTSKDPTLHSEVNAKREEMELLLENLYKALNLKPLSYSATNASIEEKYKMFYQL